MPDEKALRLGNIATISMGQSPPSFHVVEGEKGMPFLQGCADFGRQHPKSHRSCLNPPKTCRRGDVLISVRAPVGNVNLADRAYCIGRGLAAVRLPEDYPANYGWHLISYWAPFLRRVSQGTTFEAISRHDLSNLEVPDIEPEKRVELTSVLDAADQTVAKTDALIDKLKAMKQGLLHDLLSRGIDENGKLRDPQTHPEQFSKTEIGVLPNAWTIKTIDEIKANSSNALAMGPFGSNITVQNFVSEGVPVIRGINLSGPFIDFSEAVYISRKKADELHSSNIFWNDIVITHRGTIGQVSLFKANSQYDRAVVSQSQLKITCNKELISPLFLTIYLHSPFGQNLIDKAKGHTGVQAIGQPLSSVKKMKIPIPPLSEQQRIEFKIMEGDERIANEEAYRSKLVRIKKGLMHDLLTGKVRVRVPEGQARC